MATQTIWDKAREFIGGIAWRVFLLSILMKEDDYLALIGGLDKVMAEQKLIDVKNAAESMADAIRFWNKAKEDREHWRPVPGQIPPEKYVQDAKKANLLLENALKTYEAAMTGEPDSLSDSPKSI